MDLSVVFAVMLVWFIIKTDWKPDKMPDSIPYLFIVFLSLFIVHKFLLFFEIDVFALVVEKDIINSVFKMIGFN